MDTIRFTAPKNVGTILGDQLQWANSRYLIMRSCDGKGFLRADTVTGAVELHIAVGYNCNQDQLDFSSSDSGIYMKGDHNTTVQSVLRSSAGEILVTPTSWGLCNPQPVGGSQLRYSNPAAAGSAYIGQKDESGSSFPMAVGWTIGFDGSASFTNRNFVISGPGAPPPPPPPPSPPTCPPGQHWDSVVGACVADQPPPPPPPPPAPCSDAGLPYGTPGPFGNCYNCAGDIVGKQDIHGACGPLNPPPPPPPSPPTPTPPPADSFYVCLLDRFCVTMKFGSPFQQKAHAVKMTDKTGYFWFFDADNVEVLVKILDARPTNGHFWVFVAGLTNVSTEMIVTDSVTGNVKTYIGSQGVPYQPVQDVLAFE